jgi:regulator of PEP synthase PpsR (kinase-PPPase family)
MSPTKYADQEHIVREVVWSKRLFSQNGWKTVDVTNQAIEETAGRIISTLGLH